MIHHQLILMLGALLSSCLSAAAQARQVQPTDDRSEAMAMLFPAAPTYVPQSALLPSWPSGKLPTHFTLLPAATYNSAPGLQRLFPVEVFRTPFVKQVRVTVVRLWGGRLQLGGFASTTRTQNVLLGFPGSVGLAHSAAREPRAHRSYGLSLTFRLGRDAHAGRGVK